VRSEAAPLSSTAETVIVKLLTPSKFVGTLVVVNSQAGDNAKWPAALPAVIEHIRGEPASYINSAEFELEERVPRDTPAAEFSATLIARGVVGHTGGSFVVVTVSVIVCWSSRAGTPPSIARTMIPVISSPAVQDDESVTVNIPTPSVVTIDKPV
jgi:hypothetical protein